MQQGCEEVASVIGPRSAFNRNCCTRCWLVAKAIISACAMEVLCGTTRFTPTPINRPSGENTAAPKGPPLACSTFSADRRMANAILASSST